MEKRGIKERKSISETKKKIVIYIHSIGKKGYVRGRMQMALKGASYCRRKVSEGLDGA